jgi:hypothetical protein
LIVNRYQLFDGKQISNVPTDSLIVKDINCPHRQLDSKQISTVPTDIPRNTYERRFILLSAESHKVAT